jgi:hypothetical protein
MSQVNWIASIGVGILLLAFFLNIFGYLSNKNKLYALLNTIGGIISCYASFLALFYPFMFLNLVWSITAFISLIKTVPRETGGNQG